MNEVYKNEKWDCNNYPFREQTAHVISESANSAQGGRTRSRVPVFV